MKLQVEYLPINSLLPYARNARTHSDAQVAEIAASITEFGWTNPLLISEANDIIAGHGRCLAAAKLGLTEVPCIRLAGLSDAQRQAYVIADNKLALNAGWDNDTLKLEMLELKEVGFDLSLLGFSKDEIDDLFSKETVEGEGDGDGDEDEVLVTAPKRANLGDVFELDGHRLACGDSTDITVIEKLRDGLTIDMVFTDPPYGVSERTERGKAKRGKLTKGRDFSAVIGDDSTDTAAKAFELCHDVLQVPLIVYWGSNYYEFLPPVSSWLVWDKRDGVGSDDNADCELAWTNRGGPARIFAHLWKGAIKASEHGERRVHPTQKPVALAEWCISEYPKKKPTVVLDLFGGSGSTLMACEKLGVRCLMVELDPLYCDVILARWETKTGKTASLV